MARSGGLTRRQMPGLICGFVVAGASSQVMAADKVKVGVNGVISDACFYIARRKGYFAEQGIEVEFVSFDAGAKMIAPLGAGQLDAAAGASSAGLFNAAAREIDIKIVADKGSTPPGYDYIPILVRKDLVDSGKVKTYADLKGLKVAEAAQGGSQASALNEAMAQSGLGYRDLQHVFMGYPQHVAALANRAIDASITTEPSVTQAIAQGVAVKLEGKPVYPNQQVAVLLYGGDFIKKRPEVAQRFMIAYIKAARFYNDGLKDGRFAGPAAAGLIDIMVQDSNVKDRSLYEKMVPAGINPDGRPNLDSLRKDLEFYKAQKYLDGSIEADKVVDLSFADKAIQQLGPYKPTQ